MNNDRNDRAERIIAVIQKKGSDAADLRDAAHEACHALTLKVHDRWTREAIDEAAQREIRKRGRGWGLGGEMLARAVEQLVCAEVGAPCPPVELCALTALRESMAIDKVKFDVGDFADGVKAMMCMSRAKELAAQIVALGKD